MTVGPPGGEPEIGYPIRDLIRDIRAEIRSGFNGLNDRLDTQNGRVRANELAIATIRAQAAMAGAIAGISGAGIVAFAFWLLKGRLG